MGWDHTPSETSPSSTQKPIPQTTHPYPRIQPSPCALCFLVRTLFGSNGEPHQPTHRKKVPTVVKTALCPLQMKGEGGAWALAPGVSACHAGAVGM
jgi:hypothetical protein